MVTSPLVSIVIPAFNEEERLPATLEALVAFLRAQAGSFEIVLSDDGSTDRTVAVCEGLGIPELRVVKSPENKGKGHAVRLGMRSARGLVRVMCDADGSMPPEELPKLVAPIARGEADVVIGSRRVGGARALGQPLWRRMWGRIGNAFVQWALVPGVQDTQCGYKAFRGEVAESLFSKAIVDGWAFDLEVLALARRRGLRLVEVGVAWADDRRSRVRPWRDLGRVIGEALAIRARLEAEA